MFKFDMKWAALAAFSVLAAAVMFLAPDAFAHSLGTSDVVTASAALITLRAEHTDILAKIKAKAAEVVAGLTPEALAKIETEHTEMVAKRDEIERKIAAEEAKIAAPSTEPVAKAWASAFYTKAEASGLDLAALNKIVTDSATMEIATDALLVQMAAKRNADKPGAGGVQIVADAGEKFVAGVTKAIIAKVPMFNVGKPDAAGERNEFSGYTMRELARLSLETRGIRTIKRDPMEMVAQAFAPIIMAGSMTSSDFSNILGNIANKALLKGYEEAPETFDKWTGVGVLSDFKVAKAVDLGLFPSLAQVDEGAEYGYGTMSDRGVSRMLATYGKLLSISRQAIINDDLGAFTKVPSKMGQASKRTVANLVWAVLTSNPTAPDGVALFHASHKNLATGGGSALSATSLNTGRAAMGNQTDPDNIKQGLNISPAFLLVPKALQGSGHQIMTSQAEPGQDNPNVANRVANMAEVIAESRLDVASATAWYLAASPASNDTIDVEYLNGVQAPTLETKEGWNVDGVEFKVRIDAGVTLKDHRGLYKSNGA